MGLAIDLTNIFNSVFLSCEGELYIFNCTLLNISQANDYIKVKIQQREEEGLARVCPVRGTVWAEAVQQDNLPSNNGKKPQHAIFLNKLTIFYHNNKLSVLKIL